MCIGSPFSGRAQTDSSSKMTFDFGLARNRNIDLWPIVKKTNNKYEKDLELLFTIFQSRRDRVEHTKHSHLFPLFWHDSSANGTDLKLFTTYYPSIFRYTKSKDNSLNSFKLIELAPKINFLEISKSPDGLQVQNNILFQ